MLTHYKALMVVLALATVVFVLAEPVCLRFTAPADFARRRMVWYVLTITAFVSPTFWLYVLVAVPLVGWAAKKDATPIALYLLLLFVIPPIDIDIPTFGINRLFDLNGARLLGLVVLLPAVWARVQEAYRGDRLRFNALDALFLAYGALQLILLFPYEAPTNTMRRGFLFFLDGYLVYFAFSRLLPQKRSLVDAMGALCLAAAIFAPIAAFESLKGWLLYPIIDETWGHPNEHAWLFRGASLRAQAGAGHSLTLGYIMAMSIGCWTYLKSTQRANAVNVAVFGLLCTALLFSYSRGAWLTAALASIIFGVLHARKAASFMKVALMLSVVGLVVAATPFGTTVVDVLPFIGSKSQETIAYRERLAETSWLLIQQNPLFGNPFVLLQMEDLRQGQGIIDLVNAYVQVGLFYGLVGLSLFLAIHAIALRRAYARLKRWRASEDADMTMLGASLLACMVSNLVFMGTAGQSWLQWVLAGLLASYASLQPAQGLALESHSFAPGSLRPRQATAT